MKTIRKKQNMPLKKRNGGYKMLIHMFVIFLVIAFIFMYIAILKDYGFYWNITFILFSIILFFVLATGIMDIEYPYTAIQSDDTIITGTHHIYSSVNVYMSYFFYGMASVVMIYMVGYVYMYIGSKKWMK